MSDVIDRSSSRKPQVVELLLLVALIGQLVELADSQLQQPASGEFQLVGQSTGEAQLPCLVGKQLYCGEPYFIAWYKLNSSSKSWTRILQGSERELLATNSNRFTWARVQLEPGARRSRSACETNGRLFDWQAYDCAQLSIKPLETSDEGSYKCEITFSESLDFDKCPASTHSQLGVIAKPNEPELFVNGKLVETAIGTQPLSFREGAQVRLECQSTGGRPAPKLEWLNVTAGEAQLMRQWPQKRTLDPLPVGGNSSGQPVTSVALSLSLSRSDLHSRFVCLLIPQLGLASSASALAQEQLLRSPAHLNALLAGRSLGPVAPMLKWLQLDVQVKPSGLSVNVLDVASNLPIELERVENSQVYPLQPNRLYAVQCIVEDSRPASRVAWFNQTRPVQLEPVQLNSSDFLEPPANSNHRLSSFIRYQPLPSGTFRTVATLLLTSSIWDNLEEFFCRASNEAFHFDELIQVAPIISARLQVNFAPMAWLEVEPSAEANSRQTSSGATSLRVEANSPFGLRCNVAANPLAQNTILQVEWRKDGRRLVADGRGELRIERANHLHMPAQSSPIASLAELAKNGGASERTTSAKLLSWSSLKVAAASRHDAGLYACHFKLVPAPSQPANQQRQLRITSGQANQTIQVGLVEAKPRAPTIRIRSARPLLVYGPQSPPDGQKQQRRLSILPEPDASLSLKCDLADAMSNSPGHKVLWYLDGIYSHSTGSSDTNEFKLDPKAADSEIARRPGSLSCAHQAIAAEADHSPDNFQGSSMRVHHSANQLNLRTKVGPKLLMRRDLMPPVRSFTRGELAANAAARLRLVCLAQCEPLCSIDWLLNNRPLDVSSGDQTKGDWLPIASEGARTRHRRAREFSHPELGELRLVEELLPAERNDSQFSWLLVTSLAGQQQQPELGGQLATSEGSQLAEANVFAKLELSHLQIGRLLLANEEEEVGGEALLSCRLNPMLEPMQIDARATKSPIGYALLEASLWFPQTQPTSESDTSDQDDRLLHLPFNEPLNLSSLFNGRLSQMGDNELHSSWLNDLDANGSSSEIQTRLALDSGPKDVRLSFAGIEALEKEPNGVTISERLLLELADPNKPAPVLHCSAGSHTFPTPQFKWSFTDLNSVEFPIANEGDRLNLRHLIESRQRLLKVDPMSAYGVELVSGLVGNYTCTVSNQQGSSSATIAIQLQGRPLCKLSLAGELRGGAESGQLVATLRCATYSSPPLLETVWFRSGQQFAVNKSVAESALSVIELRIASPHQDSAQRQQLAGQQQQTSLKCIARNALGYSEACELSQSERQLLTGAFSSAAGSPSLSVWSLQEGGSSRTQPVSPMGNSSGEIGSVSAMEQPIRLLLRNIFARLDWLLVAFCAFAFGWLLFVVATALIKRQYGDSEGGGKQRHNNASWRFNGGQERGSNKEIVDAPFQSKICVNYYGGSNGDSEHDIVQSCSQSSHYEDFTQHQLKLQQQQRMISQQPIYFNAAHSTLTRRNLKSSLSSSSTGDSSTGSRIGQQLIRMNETRAGNTMRDFANSAAFQAPSQTSGASFAAIKRDSSGVNEPSSLNLPPTSNVPLVNGTQTSRIKLDFQQTNSQPLVERLLGRDSTFGGGLHLVRNEHIYDDVIYNQMIM